MFFCCDHLNLHSSLWHRDHSERKRQSNLPDLLPAFIHITCWTLEDLSILGLGSVISPHQRPLSSYSILLYLLGPFKGLRRFPYLLSKSTGKQCSSSAGGDQTLLSARARRLSGVKLWGGARLIRGLSRAKVCAFTAWPCVCMCVSLLARPILQALILINTSGRADPRWPGHQAVCWQSS